MMREKFRGIFVSYTISIFYVIVICVMVVYLFGVMVFRPINKAVGEKQVTVTVTEKVVKNFLKESKYLIFTQDDSGDTQVFEITDSLLRFRFDSADVYAQISPNQKYQFTVRGSRIPIFSWYPNIYEVEKIE